MLSIGTILKTKFYLSVFAIGLLLNRKSIIYSIIYEAIVYPGCTLAVNIIAFFSFKFGLVSPIVR